MHPSIHGYIALACSLVSPNMGPQAIPTAASIHAATKTGSTQPKRTDVPTRFQANA